MPKFFSPADKAADWQQLLAKPDLHWRTGYSARSIAHSWTEARQLDDITLYLGWVVGDAEYLTR